MIKWILDEQHALQDALGNVMGEGEVAIKENVLALMVEAGEVLGEINWKPWSRVRREVDRDKLLKELVDVLQFWANIVNAAGFDEEAIVKAYREKLAINYRRIVDGY